jgi:hypothetical protein
MLGTDDRRVNRKHVQRLMRKMGIAALGPKPPACRAGLYRGGGLGHAAGSDEARLRCVLAIYFFMVRPPRMRLGSVPRISLRTKGRTTDLSGRT